VTETATANNQLFFNTQARTVVPLLH